MNTEQHKIRLIQYNFLLQRLYQIKTNDESHRINFVTLFEPLQKLISHHLYQQLAGDQGDQQPQKPKVKQVAKFRPHRVKSNSLSKSLQVYHVKLTKLYNKLDQKSVKPHHKLSKSHKTLTPSNKTQTSQSPYQRKLSRKSKNLSRTFSSFSLSHQQATVIPISSLANRSPSLSVFPKFRLSNQPQNPILQNSIPPSTNQQQNNRYRTVSSVETFGVRKQTLTINRLPQQQMTQTTEGNRIGDIKRRQQQRQVFSFQEQLDINITPLQPNLNLTIYQKQLNRTHLKKYQQYIS